MYKQPPLYLNTNMNSSDRKVQIAAEKMQIGAENKWFSAQTNANCSCQNCKVQLKTNMIYIWKQMQNPNGLSWFEAQFCLCVKLNRDSKKLLQLCICSLCQKPHQEQNYEHDVMIRWYDDTIIQWYNDTMIQWYNYTIMMMMMMMIS